jgi:hypothetical protein
LPSQVVEVNTVEEDHGDMDVTVDTENMNVVNMDSMNKDKPEQVPTSQVEGVVNVNEVHVEVNVIVIVIDSDSDVDSEYDEDVIELLSAHDCEL